MIGRQAGDVSHQVRRAAEELARWAVGNLTAQVNEAMPGSGPEREADRRNALNRLRSRAVGTLYSKSGDDPLRCLLAFLAVADLRPLVRDWEEVGVPAAAKPLFTAAASGRVGRRDLLDLMRSVVEPEERWWESHDDLFEPDPEPPKVAGRYPAWAVSHDLLPYDGTGLACLLPSLWATARERSWATTDNGTTFHVPTKLPWHRDPNRWDSPEHRAFFAALCWMWEQAERGRSRLRVSDGPRFVLSFYVVPRGHDRAWSDLRHVFGGHDRARGRAFARWDGGETILRSPLHLLELVPEVLGSDEVEVLTAGLPDGLHFHLDTRAPSWPWRHIRHHDLAVLGRPQCEECFGLGYTIDAAKRAEARVVWPCPECCGQYLAHAHVDGEDEPWPRADDAAFEQYTALRRQLSAGRPGKPKGKDGRKLPEIKVTARIVETPPADMAARRAQLERVVAQVEQRRRDAEEIKEAVKVKPRPRMQVDAMALAADFVQVASLAGVSLDEKDILVETLPAPHERPKWLPPGKQAVYVFCTAWDCLKVGRAGQNSEARYTSQNYNPRTANSTLSQSLLRCDAVQRATLLAGVLPEPTEESIGTWVETHTTRYNFFIPADQPPAVLSLLETFLQCRLKPALEQK